MQLGDRQWIVKTVNIVIEHLNKYGACVIDEFLGEERGSEILENVKKLQDAHLFREGQLGKYIFFFNLFTSDRWVKSHCLQTVCMSH